MAAAFPTAHQLALIAAIAAHGSVTAAASALGLTQPAVTAQLRAAESTLGRRLFIRARGGLVPTTAGRAVAAYAQRQDVLRRGLLDALARPQERTGTLYIGASSGPAEQWLPQRLSTFRHSHPRVEVRVIVGNSRDTLAHVEAGSVDLAVAACTKRARTLQSVLIGHDRIVAIAAPQSRWCKGSISGRSLSDALIVLREDGSSARRFALAALRRANARPAQFMPAASDEAIAKFAAADLGVGLLSRFVAQRYVEAGALGYVRIPGWKCPRRFYMLRRRDVPNPLADAFWTLAATHASRPTGSPVDSAERQAHALPHGRGAASG